MKKFICMALSAAALLTASCSQDEDLTAGSASRVSITVNSPEFSTRSDGSSATQLQYLLYDIQADGTKVLCGEVTTETVDFPITLDNLDVVTGHNYAILLWASAPKSPYSVDWEKGTLTVDYEKATANSEALDAFYAYETFTVEGSVTLNVTMTRPFAMIIIGATTAPAAGTTSSMTIDGVPASLNLFTGELSDETATATFGYAAVPTAAFPVDGYSYLSFAYVLAPKTATPTTVTVSYKPAGGEATRTTLEEVPLQANFRTNVSGVTISN